MIPLFDSRRYTAIARWFRVGGLRSRGGEAARSPHASHHFETLRLVVVATLLGSIDRPSAAWAQETVTIPRSRLEALERKAEEAERLAVELEKARAEINRLKGHQEAARVTKGATAKPAAPAGGSGASTAPVVRPAPASAPLQSLPALREGEEVLVTTLLEHFSANPTGATERYARKQVRLRGVITQVGKDLFTSSYRLTFRLPDESLRVVCNVSPPAELTKVYADSDHTTIYGETDRIPRRALARVGQEVVLTGRCGGLKDGGVTLNGCKLVGP